MVWPKALLIVYNSYYSYIEYNFHSLKLVITCSAIIPECRNKELNIYI